MVCISGPARILQFLQDTLFLYFLHRLPGELSYFNRLCQLLITVLLHGDYDGRAASFWKLSTSRVHAHFDGERFVGGPLDP